MLLDIPAAMIGSFSQDVRHGLRSLRRTPAFTAAAVLTLALGIGATTTIFSVLNAALLKPLPYPDPDRLLALATPATGAQTGQMFLHVRDRARAFRYVAAQGRPSGWNIAAGDFATYADALQVSEAYFEAHGAAPLLGRTFSRADDRPGAPHVVMISESVWARAYGRRVDAVGDTLLLGGVPHTVIGVVSDSFQSIPDVDIWTPVRIAPTDNTLNYRVVGRLADGATAAQASEELDALRPGIARELPRTNPRGLSAITWMPLRQSLAGNMRRTLLTLLGAAGLLLLIACVNVASLQLSRALGRRRELATRAALGAGRARLARQVLVESALLAFVGAAAGVAIAAGSAQLLLELVSQNVVAEFLPGLTLGLDWRVLAFALAAGSLSTLAAGIVPAWVSSRDNLKTMMIGGPAVTAPHRTLSLRRFLAAGEVALAVMLLVGAGLLVRTLINLTSTGLGFNPRGVTVGRMSLRGAVDDGQQLERVLEQGLARIRTIPGVAAASASSGIPVEQSTNLPLEPPASGRVTEMRAIEWRYVTAGYFDVFGIPRRAGRLFDGRDTATGAPVAIVSEAFARAYFGRLAVVGETIRLAPAFQDPPRQIVGVVADARTRSDLGWASGLTALGSGFTPAVFVPAGQASATAVRGTHLWFPMAWSVKSARPAAEVQRAVAEALRGVAPTLPFIRFESMDDVIARDIDIPRFIASLLGAFAGLGLALAAIGLYGLMSYAAAQRTRELGIRVALGATAARIVTRFAGEALLVACTGLVLGIGGAVLATNVLQAFLFGVTPLDSSTFVAAAALLLAVTAAATALPAARAARVDPVRALRTE